MHNYEEGDGRSYSINKAKEKKNLQCFQTHVHFDKRDRSTQTVLHLYYALACLRSM